MAPLISQPPSTGVACTVGAATEAARKLPSPSASTCACSGNQEATCSAWLLASPAHHAVDMSPRARSGSGGALAFASSGTVDIVGPSYGWRGCRQDHSRDELAVERGREGVVGLVEGEAPPDERLGVEQAVGHHRGEARDVAADVGSAELAALDALAGDGEVDGGERDLRGQ